MAGAEERDGEPPKLGWDGSTSEDWRAQVNSWPWRPIGPGDWEKSGTCERCSHAMTLETITGGGFLGMPERAMQDRRHAELVDAPILPDALSADDERFFARCDCSADHPGRPVELKQGCGRWAYIDPAPTNE